MFGLTALSMLLVLYLHEAQFVGRCRGCSDSTSQNCSLALHAADLYDEQRMSFLLFAYSDLRAGIA